MEWEKRERRDNGMGEKRATRDNIMGEKRDKTMEWENRDEAME
jgi:hypothetical protein